MILTGMRARPLSDVSLEFLKVSKQLGTFPFKSKQIFASDPSLGSSFRKNSNR